MEPEYAFTPLLPPSSTYSSYLDLPELFHAQELVNQQNSKLNSNNNEELNVIEVIEDKEIDSQSIEITGSMSQITFNTDPDNLPIQRYLTLHLRSMGKFVSFDVTVVDENKKIRVFKIGNERSQVVIHNEIKPKNAKDKGNIEKIKVEKKSICELPLTIKSGWQMINLDIPNLCSKAFGTSNPVVLSVTIYGDCRVSKIFFHHNKCSDAEMPGFLRVGNC